MDSTNCSQAVRDLLTYLKIEKYDIDIVKCDLEGFSVKREGKKYTVRYSRLDDLMKAFGYISTYRNQITEISQKKRAKHLGYLIDTARNAVPTTETLKKLFLRLASYGYNRVYLYTEDVLSIENETFYGYLRGRYTKQEIQEIDAYANDLGISIIPCIQTLAHLNCIFKWPEYSLCRDNTDILLIDDDRTYELIDNIFSTVSNTFKSKHIHIGMDEAYLVGRGKYMDKNGYVNRYELLNRHVSKVIEIAQKYGFTAEMWSDMYFSEAFGGYYYSATQEIPSDMCKKIPKEIGLVYWDYLSRDEKLIDNMFLNHLKTGNEIIFAGGAWKWSGWNPSTKKALTVSRRMLNACHEYDVQTIILTAWSDDGAEASVFSTLPSVIMYSLSIYGDEITDEKINFVMERQYGISLKDYMTADMDFLSLCDFEESYLFGTLPKVLLYNDPLSGYYDGIFQKFDLARAIDLYKKELSRIAGSTQIYESSMFEELRLLCEVLEIKWDLGLRIRRAYQTNEELILKDIADIEIPELINRIEVFKACFYSVWMNENKSNGFQTHDIRIGGLIERLKTTQKLIYSYLNKDIKVIQELEENLIGMDDKSAKDMILWTDWSKIHSVYVV